MVYILKHTRLMAPSAQKGHRRSVVLVSSVGTVRHTEVLLLYWIEARTTADLNTINNKRENQQQPYAPPGKADLIDAHPGAKNVRSIYY